MHDWREERRRALEKQLRRHFEGELRFDVASRKIYSTDASIYQIEPLGVVIPKHLRDVHTALAIAAEHRVPIVPRGGGTSLSGQSIGPGLIIDCSKHLNRILELNLASETVRLQPGVVLEQLNRYLAPHGYQFGPEVSTHHQATLGGMIGNNSAGSRSIVYGKTIDHVVRLQLALGDGTALVAEPLSHWEWRRRCEAQTREGEIYRTVHQLVTRHASEIHRRFPRINRRVSGYNLDVFADRLAPANGFPADDTINLAWLIVGSEGTLGFVTEAEVKIVRRPRVRMLAVPHFGTLAASLDALATCLEFSPSAVELLDQLIVELAEQNIALRREKRLIVGRPAAVLLVELQGEDRREVEDRLHRLVNRLNQLPGVQTVLSAKEPHEYTPLWNLRTAGLPVLLSMPGDRKPTTFVEDAAVSPERLPEFAQRFREILRRHGTDGAFYGHASVGCLHIRPILNLKKAEDVERMRKITAEVVDLVLEFNGALSGEHGDGLARSEWNRKLFGDVVYETFRQIKRVFDPLGQMNPGKVVDAPPMTENLRYGPTYLPYVPDHVFDYRRQGGFLAAIELCNGSGLCRKTHSGIMCPSYRATRDEKDTTRARANALRLALTGEQPLRDFTSPWVYEVLDLCLMCKACKAECPSNVDLAKLKAEFLRHYYRVHPRPLRDWLLAHWRRWIPWAARFAPLSQWLTHRRTVRWLLEKLASLDRRRSLPQLTSCDLLRWFRKHTPPPQAGQCGRVLFLADCFTTWSEPEIGRAAIRLLEQAGYRVEIWPELCCGRILISKGFLDEAQNLVARQALQLARYLRRCQAIVGVEPSCLLTLLDEWPELYPHPATEIVARHAHLIEAWLFEQHRSGVLPLEFASPTAHLVVHTHCHQKAVIGSEPTVDALRLLPQAPVDLLDTTCCGMAGSFGYEHYDVSVAIARLSLLPELEKRPQAVIVASGSSCRHQIHDLTGRRAYHPVEILAQHARSLGLSQASPNTPVTNKS
ncbi:MAG: FAD-linked oxidase C-terminal domain-containing protein [Gemmatales bacterium]|nr:FAD-binding protein [Gemmatales bacterium]MDW7994595.1 FAD-linked oxidase C-terminal domain-containing protein [Gemmatales bacterium]